MSQHNARRAIAAIALSSAVTLPAAGHAEAVKIGVVKATVVGDLIVAVDRGYFAAEGLSPEIVNFESAQPVAVATASGDIDFGSVGLTGGFYSLAGQGVLKIVSGSTHDTPGYHIGATIVSNRAYDGGLTNFKDFAGRSVAITQVGSPYHYSLALLLEKYGVDLKSIQLQPVQSVPNEVSVIVGGKADAAIIPVPIALPVVDRGDAHLLGFTGDETPWQFGVVFAAAKTTNERQDMMKRFLRALHKGARDYHAAFSGSHDERRDGPSAPEILALLAKYSGQSVERLRLSISYFDAEGRLDTKDIEHQIAWYRAQGMLKTEFGAADIIDKRYVAPLPIR